MKFRMFLFTSVQPKVKRLSIKLRCEQPVCILVEFFFFFCIFVDKLAWSFA